MKEKSINQQAAEQLQSTHFTEHKTAGKLMAQTYVDFQAAIQDALSGISTRQFELKNDVVFIVDNNKEVHLRVRKIRLHYSNDQVMDLDVECRTDFENVLILAKRLNMKISAFSTYFSVRLSASKAFIEEFNDQILAMKQVKDFFETLDELKRPIFLNLNHYVVSRISD